jgi:DNA-binding SARP family transcriptional activator/streptogramin lyase
MRYLILGPLEVRDGDSAVPVGGGQQRKLLGVLLLHRNEVVSSDRLIDELWGSRPPGTAAKALQGYVSQLRKRLGHETVLTVGSGYRLDIGPDEIDAEQFERLLDDARRLDRGAAALRLREALGLWRGPALADFAYDDFAQNEIQRLEELRRSCLERRIDIELALGHHDDLVPELEALVREHPLHERLRRHLMLALYRCGRQADALEAYRDARAVLQDELGLDPSDELQALQRAILEHDESIAAPPRVELGDHVRTPALRIRRWRRRAVLLVVLGVALLGAAVAAAVLALGGGGARVVAIPPNSLAVVDARHRQVSSYTGIGRRPVAIAVGERSIWVTNSGDGTVSRLDKRGRLERTIGIGADVNGIAIGFGSVWVAGGNDGTITRIDPSVNQIERTIKPSGSLALAPNPVFFVATDDRWVWATQGVQLLRIDPRTNRVDRRITVGSPTGLCIGGSPTGEGVWVTTGSERLLRIDPGTMWLTAHEELSATAYSPVFAHGSLWLILATAPRGQIQQLENYTLATATALTDVHNPTALAADGAGGVWVADVNGNLTRIGADGKVSPPLHLGRSLAAVGAGGGTVWAAVTA